MTTLDATCPIVIRPQGGLVEFKGGNRHTFILENSQYVEVDGRVNNVPYQIFIKNAAMGQQGVAVYGASAHIDIHDLKVFNPLGFAGIMVKNSPYCFPNTHVVTGYCGELDTDGNEIYIHDINIHHNYIAHTEGEGIYVGDTKYLFAFDCGKGTYYRQHIENVTIAHNIIANTRRDGIQLGSCTVGGFIHDNTIIDYGLDNLLGDANGIQIGVGTQGASCYNNFIYRTQPVSKGHGIICQGAGDNCIYNNIIYRTAENGIYINESTESRPDPNASLCVPLNPNLIPSSVMHNTFVNPGCTDMPNANTLAGIRLAYTTGVVNASELVTNIFGHFLEKNLIVSKEGQTVAVKVDAQTTPPLDGCQQNLLKLNVTDLTTVFDYGGGMTSAEWFIPLTTQTDIIDAAPAASCANYCTVNDDHFGTGRPLGPLPDYGAVEVGKGKPTPGGGKSISVAENANGLMPVFFAETVAPPTLSPNPFRNELYVSFTASCGGYYTLEIVDLDGRSIATERLYAEQEQQFTHRLTDQVQGTAKVYVVRLISPEGVQHTLRAVKM